MGKRENADREAELLDAQMDEGTLSQGEYNEAMGSLRSECSDLSDFPSDYEQ